MKILFIRSSKYFSGAEKYNVELLGELRKYFDIVLLTNLENLRSYGFKAWIEKWLPEEVGTKKQLLKNLFYAPIFVLRYLKLVRNFNIVCLQSRTEMIFLTPILKLFKKKIVWIQHGPMFISHASRIIMRLYVFASKFMDKLIAVSQDTKKDLITGGIPKEKITVIYIGVQISQIKKQTHKFTVGFLGTVTKEKGIDDFIEVVKITKCTALIIGNGPDLSWVKKCVACTGFVKDVQKYLNRIDILLLPTRHHEGISMAILEAQAVGIPVFATDIGGNREIVEHGYNGFLYKVGDVMGMARDIRMLEKDRNKLKEMRRNAQDTVIERFNIRRQAKLFADFFQSL